MSDALSPLVTVIIPSRNSSRTLPQCLRALSQQVTSFEFATIVMHSGDDHLEHGDVPLPHFTVELCDDRLLPGVKRNRAALRTNTPWLAFLDADCVPSPAWLARLVAAAARRGVSGVGGAVAMPQAPDLASWAMHMLEFAEWLPKARGGAARDFPSCNALYSRSAFLSIGGFPEDFFPCEDTVLNARLRRAGHRLWFAPEACVTHIQTHGVALLVDKNRTFGAQYGRAASVYRLPGRHFRRRYLRPLVLAVRWYRCASRTVQRLPICDVWTLVRASPYVWLYLSAWADGFFAPLRVPSRDTATEV